MKIVKKAINLLATDKTFEMGMQYQSRTPRMCSCSC